MKRVREIKDVSTTRTREGDAVAAVLAGNTKQSVVFFTSQGSAYVSRIVDIPPSTGYGDPVQKLFKFKDGERVVAALSLDPRVRTKEPLLLAATKNGYALRFSLEGHTEVSTRAGRRFARVEEGDEIIGVLPASEDALVVAASEKSHVLVCKAAEVNLLSNPGRGVTLVKLSDDDRLVGFSIDAPLTIESEKGRTEELKALKKQLAARGGKGTQVCEEGASRTGGAGAADGAGARGEHFQEQRERQEQR